MSRRTFPGSGHLSVEVKICGLTRLADALTCAEFGADAIGINFWPRSKRYHPLEAASLWLEQVPESLTRVGVFVNAAAEDVEKILGSGLIDLAQFHGDEDIAYCSHFTRLGIPWIKALALRSNEDLEKAALHPSPALLLDAYQPGEYGGSGIISDWPLAARAVTNFPHKPIILSGGLTPENVRIAVEQVKPAALDVASGVESSPGIKDPAKIQRFISAARF